MTSVTHANVEDVSWRRYISFCSSCQTCSEAWIYWMLKIKCSFTARSTAASKLGHSVTWPSRTTTACAMLLREPVHTTVACNNASYFLQWCTNLTQRHNMFLVSTVIVSCRASLSVWRALAGFAMASLDSEAIMGVWGCNSQQRSRGRAPVVGHGQSPLKLNALCVLHVQRKLQICPITDIWETSLHHTVDERFID